MKLFLIVVTILLISGFGRASATEYRKATDVERLQAYCDEVGAQAEQGYFAFGSPMFVLGAGIGAKIRRNIDHQRAFDNCMQSHGYVRTDQDQSIAVPDSKRSH